MTTIFSFFLKIKITIIFLIYGFIVSTLMSLTMYSNGEYLIQPLLNWPIEHLIIPPTLLYFANDLGEPLTREQLIVFRSIISVMFWGIIGVALQVLIPKNQNRAQ